MHNPGSDEVEHRLIDDHVAIQEWIEISKCLNIEPSFHFDESNEAFDWMHHSGSDFVPQNK